MWQAVSFDGWVCRHTDGGRPSECDLETPARRRPSWSLSRSTGRRRHPDVGVASPFILRNVPLTAEVAKALLSAVGPHDMTYMIRAQSNTPSPARRARGPCVCQLSLGDGYPRTGRYDSSAQREAGGSLHPLAAPRATGIVLRALRTQNARGRNR
jgi:hypothetical protein